MTPAARTKLWFALVWLFCLPVIMGTAGIGLIVAGAALMSLSHPLGDPLAPVAIFLFMLAAWGPGLVVFATPFVLALQRQRNTERHKSNVAWGLLGLSVVASAFSYFWLIDQLDLP